MNTRTSKLLLAVGFVSVTAAVISARLSLATGYEISIYQSTPLTFWAGIILAVICATVGALNNNQKFSMASIGLGCLSVIVLLLLPLLRGYFFFGEGDQMTHLGIVKDILAGDSVGANILYPALHYFSATLSIVTGLSPRYSLMIVVVVFFVPWLIGIPLLVREFSDRRVAPAIGAVSAWILLPLNPINVLARTHPSSQLIFFAPIVLWAFFRVSEIRSRRHIAVLELCLLTAVLVHPQQAVNIIAFAFSFAILTRFIGKQQITNYPIGYVPVVGIVALFTWLAATPEFNRAAEIIVFAVLEATAGSSAASRASSLDALGISASVLLLKIATKYLVFAIGTLFSLWAWWQRNHVDSRIIAIALSALPIFLIAVPFAAAGKINQYPRYIGFVMVFGTVLGAIGFTHVFEGVRSRVGDVPAKTFVSIFFVLIFLVALPTVFVSPYVALTNPQVTEGQYDGYETAFEYRSGETQFVEIRSPMFRYRDAIYGALSHPDIEQGPLTGSHYSSVPDHFANRSLANYYDDETYLGVTGADYKRDAVLYDGFRYSHRDFAYLQRDPKINRVVDNGQFELYHLNQTDV